MPRRFSTSTTPPRRHAGIYNLWGQVPVPNLSGNPVAYYNLTAAGAIHSGNYGVSLWYRNFVAPTLGDQAPLLHALRLRGQHRSVHGPPRGEPRAVRAETRESVGPGVQAVAGSRAEFSGTAAPGSTIRITWGRRQTPPSSPVPG